MQIKLANGQWIEAIALVNTNGDVITIGGGGSGDGLTNTQLRENPIEIQGKVISGETRTEFLLVDVEVVGVSGYFSSFTGIKTFQLIGSTNSDLGSVNVTVEGSQNNLNWDTLGTISLILNTSGVSDSFSSNDRYMYIRCNVTEISGSGAKVSMIVGY